MTKKQKNTKTVDNEKLIEAIEHLAQRIDNQTIAFNNLTNAIQNQSNQPYVEYSNTSSSNRFVAWIERQMNKLSTFYKITVLLAFLFLGLGAIFYLNP